MSLFYGYTDKTQEEIEKLDTDKLSSDFKIKYDIVTDLCPPINGMSKKYDKIYSKI